MGTSFRRPRSLHPPLWEHSPPTTSAPPLPNPTACGARWQLTEANRARERTPQSRPCAPLLLRDRRREWRPACTPSPPRILAVGRWPARRSSRPCSAGLARVRRPLVCSPATRCCRCCSWRSWLLACPLRRRPRRRSPPPPPPPPLRPPPRRLTMQARSRLPWPRPPPPPRRRQPHLAPAASCRAAQEAMQRLSLRRQAPVQTASPDLRCGPT